MQAILALTDLFLPSGDGFALLTSAKDAAGAAAELLSHGLKAIVHKQGATGVNYIDASGAQFVPSFKVQEVDPTGAGDCFGGAFTALWLRGEDIHRALTIAAAAGALAVTRRGPMEGASSMEALLAFAASRKAGLMQHPLLALAPAFAPVAKSASPRSAPSGRDRGNSAAWS